MSFPYMRDRLGLLTQVIGLTATDNPATAGFDHHHLYRDNVNPRLRKLPRAQREQAALDRLPYKQDA